jgi:hypothetical protein
VCGESWYRAGFSHSLVCSAVRSAVAFPTEIGYLCLVCDLTCLRVRG